MGSNKKEKKVKKNKSSKIEEEMEEDTTEMLISEKKVKKNKSSKIEEEMEEDTTEMLISKKKVKKNKSSKIEEEMEDDTTETKSSWGNVKEHKDQLQRLQEKDPEFYEYLKAHDKKLLEFDDDGIDEDAESDMDDDDGLDNEDMNNVHQVGSTGEKQDEASKKVITSAMVDSWCSAIRENARVGAVRSIMRAFRTACHYGDDGEADSSAKLSIMSSSVFNKIMLFVLSEMDGILRTLLKLPASGGKKETILELVHTRAWKNYNHLVKSYLGNALHVLTQMTDTEMISFTIRRLKYSSLFLAAFPSLLRKYIKAVLHFWGTGGGALPVVSFLFLRDLCIRLGSDCVDECFKGIYKSYILSSQFVNATKLQHVQFLANCVNELLGVDLPAAYQHAFVFIRQLAMILREALDTRKKNSYAKVYEWKYINCLELWTGAVCAYGAEADLKPLAYPLTQIISGVARLVPTARYLPLRLRCVRMLNRIAASTNTFIPVAVILLDMLDMKELNRPPTGGVGKAVDLHATLRVSKATLKTRSFQEACVFSVIEELAEHLAQWSYSVAFTELSFIPSVRLRNFCKSTKVDRFRRETREFIRQIESNSDFTNKKRMSIKYLPNDPAAASFLEDEKKSGLSPLSQYASMLRQRAQQRSDSLKESSVLVGESSSIFGRKRAGSDDDDDFDDDEDDDDTGNEVGAAVFSSSWLPKGNPKTKSSEEEKKEKTKKRKKTQEEDVTGDEDIVQDLVLSSEEDEDAFSSDDPSDTEQKGIKPVPRKQQTQSQRKKPSGKFSKKENFHINKSKKRKRANK